MYLIKLSVKGGLAQGDPIDLSSLSLSIFRAPDLRGG